MNLGKMQKMKVSRISKIGATLDNAILLPKNEIIGSIKEGDEIEVFLYKDSEDRLIATMKTPKVQVGSFALLKVVDTTKIGAFLDWGLAKDLFLPFKEQIHPLKKGDWVPVTCYVDHSERLAATSRIKNRFPRPRGIKENQYVTCQVYALSEKYGAFVIVEGLYNGLIPKNKSKEALRVGERVRARVEYIQPDGKMNLSTFSSAAQRVDLDALTLIDLLKKNAGYLAVDDHSEPEIIRATVHMSKGKFKNAAGHLLKDGKIRFENGGIRLAEQKKMKEENKE